MKQIYTRVTKGFTLIELIFVIIILGIVSSIGSSIIANIYQNYLLERATYRASLKTELAAQQIANLLSYRIPKTTIARDPSDLTDNVLITDPTLASDTTHTLLEWIGTDNDGFSASVPPAWSGFCDRDASDDRNYIATRGSNLSLANTIIKNLSNNTVKLTGTQYPAIFFKHENYTKNNAASTVVPYRVLGDGTYNACMGVVSTDKTCISTVSYNATNPDRLTFQHPAGSPRKIIVEHYKLAWSAYSIWQVEKSPGSKRYDLKLCYNYQPWEDERLSSNGCPGTLSTIITNVSVFKFAESGNTFRFKLCAQENIGEDYNISICKEKAIVL